MFFNNSWDIDRRMKEKEATTRVLTFKGGWVLLTKYLWLLVLHNHPLWYEIYIYFTLLV